VTIIAAVAPERRVRSGAVTAAAGVPPALTPNRATRHHGAVRVSCVTAGVQPVVVNSGVARCPTANCEGPHIPVVAGCGGIVPAGVAEPASPRIALEPVADPVVLIRASAALVYVTLQVPGL
jgi:hypothetical protein